MPGWRSLYIGARSETRGVREGEGGVSNVAPLESRCVLPAECEREAGRPAHGCERPDRVADPLRPGVAALHPGKRDLDEPIQELGRRADAEEGVGVDGVAELLAREG